MTSDHKYIEPTILDCMPRLKSFKMSSIPTEYDLKLWLCSYDSREPT